MAKRIAAQHPSQLVLVDPTDKSDLAENLAQLTVTKYRASLSEVDGSTLPDGVIVINAAGKEGATDESGINQVLEANADKEGVFVDIRPHLTIDVVEKAKELGWDSHTGHGINAQNDYILLTGITDNLKMAPPTFEHFEKLVAQAS
jgi:hypothetical protein